MEEDMMMPNVAPAPMMEGTPVAPNLSEQMPTQTEEVTQAEIQEAQGALQQILQVIDMLIQQGLSAEEIAQFLEQYGISEDELEQAAQVLGVNINQLLGGQMQAPQEPMMMAGGGPGVTDISKSMPQFDQYRVQQFAKKMQQPQMQQPQLGLGSLLDDNEPRFEDRSPENQIFSLQTSIDNLITEYDMLVRNKEFDRAQAVADEINNIDVQISQIKAGSPMMMANGGPSTSIDPSYISEYLQMLEQKQAELFKLSRKDPGVNPTGLVTNLSQGRRNQDYLKSRRDLQQAYKALDPAVFNIYETGQFRKLPTTFSKGVIEDYIDFVNNKKRIDAFKVIEKKN